MRNRTRSWAALAGVAAAAAVITAAGGCASRVNEAALRSEVVGVLEAQEAAWNRGDVRAFMQGYWNDERLTFSSGGRTERGWQQTLERYLRRYPTAERMGRLTFDGIELRPLCERAVLVLGRWRLERAEDPVGGNFSLIFERIEGQWVITHDHTSVEEPAAGS